ncbi:MAG TPA: RecX family transcriptional regulator [Victivallales bacterium]|nr:RecX family transcriptional regulator [Victivallales bacterium]
MNCNISADIEPIMKKAASLLCRRMHSAHELRNKLIKKFSPEAVNMAINELIRLDYLNDARFASAFAAELQKKGLGRIMVINRMMKRGLPLSLCEETVPQEPKETEIEHANEFLRTRRKSLERVVPQNRKDKLFRMLKSRGFSNETIFEILDSYFAD